MTTEPRGPGDRWEPWRLPRLDALAEDGFHHLARYVVAREVLDQPRFSHAFGPPRTDLSPRDRIEVVWAELVRQEISYTRALHGPGGTERIRHPGILLRENAAGTCVDLATLLAAALMRAGVPTWLVMLTGDESAHVGLAVHTGATLDELATRGYLPDYSEHTVADGTLAVPEALREELIDDPHLELIDATAAVLESERRTLSDARDQLRVAIEDTRRYPHLHLIDVRVRHEGDDPPYDFVPRVQGILSVELDGVAERWTDFPSRQKARRDVLAGIGSMVVIRGDSGLGKSQLALAAAQSVDQGFGWFLSGESTLAFTDSLALAEARERGLDSATIVDDAATRRTDLNQAARTRLELTTDPWVVVIDNADDSGSVVREIVDLLPTPKPGQALILTSTLEEDDLHEALQGRAHQVVSLDALGSDESRRLPGAALLDEELLDLSDGNPLLIDAFARFMNQNKNQDDAIQLEVPAEALATKTPESAARLLLESTLAHREVAPEQLARLALMPPDSIPPSAIPESDRERLILAGLLSPRVAGNLGLHRIFGEAARSLISDRYPDVLPRAAEGLLHDREIVQHLYQRGTHVSVIANQLADSSDGIALASLGIIQEQHQPLESHGSFERAIDALGEQPATRDERRALAEAFHARARAVHQNTKAPRDAKLGALVPAQRAAELFAESREDDSTWDEAGYAKARAMEGLLLRGLARTTDEFTEALAILRDSHQRRLDLLGADDPLVDRGHFNPAGAYIGLSELDPENAAQHLDEAHQIYEETQRFRARFYPAPSATTAASTNGLALVAYYRALRVDLVAADREAAARHLADAAGFAAEAMMTRQAAGAKPDAIAQSARILAKVGLLRWTIAHDSLGTLIGEAVDELGGVGQEG